MHCDRSSKTVLGRAKLATTALSDGRYMADLPPYSVSCFVPPLGAAKSITSVAPDSSIIKAAKLCPWLGYLPFPMLTKERQITEYLHIPSRLDIVSRCREAVVKYRSELSSLCGFELPPRSGGAGHSNFLLVEGKANQSVQGIKYAGQSLLSLPHAKIPP